MIKTYEADEETLLSDIKQVAGITAKLVDQKFFNGKHVYQVIYLKMLTFHSNSI